MEDKWLVTLFVVAGLLVGTLIGATGFSQTEIVEKEVPVIQEKLVEKECPSCPEVTCPEVEMPEVENADNELLNEFLEDEFSDEYGAIESNATMYAMEELEDDDYEVVLEYLESIVDGAIDEDSIEVDEESMEIDVEVTKLGLGEDEDKKAIVTFELEVEYELEEGVRDEYERDLVVEYEVFFEEGDFDDEEVTLLNIA